MSCHQPRILNSPGTQIRLVGVLLLLLLGLSGRSLIRGAELGVQLRKLDRAPEGADSESGADLSLEAQVGFDRSRLVVAKSMAPVSLLIENTGVDDRIVFIQGVFSDGKELGELPPEKLRVPGHSRLVHKRVFRVPPRGPVEETLLSIRVLINSNVRRDVVARYRIRESVLLPVLMVVVGEGSQKTASVYRLRSGEAKHFDLHEYRQRCVVSACDEALLPVDARAWSGVRAVLVHKISSLTTVSDRQWGALRSYVIAGGHVIVEGDTGDVTKAGSRDFWDLVPVDVSTLRKTPGSMADFARGMHGSGSISTARSSWFVAGEINRRKVVPIGRERLGPKLEPGSYWLAQRQVGKGTVSYVGLCLIRPLDQGHSGHPVVDLTREILHWPSYGTHHEVPVPLEDLLTSKPLLNEK